MSVNNPEEKNRKKSGKKKPLPNFNKWTDQDEQKLHYLTSSKIEMKDTVLGKMKASHTHKFEASFYSFTK